MTDFKIYLFDTTEKSFVQYLKKADKAGIPLKEFEKLWVLAVAEFQLRRDRPWCSDRLYKLAEVLATTGNKEQKKEAKDWLLDNLRKKLKTEFDINLDFPIQKIDKR